MSYFIVGLIGYTLGTFAGVMGVVLCRAAKNGDEMYGIDEERM